MRLLLILLVVNLFYSCSSSTIEQEMAEFCSCLKKHTENAEGRDECYVLMERMLEQYSYDPAALAEIMDASEKCY
jgi:hypothetical protein